jgi:hypothetical protein
MTYKTLSVKQPYATLICAGVKTVENRTWKTDYRGRLLIHASGDHNAYPDLDCLPKKFAQKVVDFSNGEIKGTVAMQNYDKLLDRTYQFYGQNPMENRPPQDWLKEAVKKHGFFMPAQAIIGEVTLYGIFDNLYDVNDDFAERGSTYFWFLCTLLTDFPSKNGF